MVITFLGPLAQDATAADSPARGKGYLPADTPAGNQPSEEAATPSWLAGRLGWKFNSAGQPLLGLQPELHGVVRSLPWELAATLDLTRPEGNAPAGSVLRLEQGKLVLHAPGYKITLSGRERLAGSLLVSETVADTLAWERSGGIKGASLKAGVISAPGLPAIVTARWEQDQEPEQGWIRQLQLEFASALAEPWGQAAGVAARIEGAWSDRAKAQLSLGWARGGASAGLALEYRGAGWAWSSVAAVRSPAFAPLNAGPEDLPLWSFASTVDRFQSSYRIGLSGAIKRYIDGSASQWSTGGEISGGMGRLQWLVSAPTESRTSSSSTASRQFMLTWNPSFWRGLTLRLDADDPLPGNRATGGGTRLFTLQGSGKLAGWPFVLESSVSWRDGNKDETLPGQITTNLSVTSPQPVAGGQLSLKGGLTYAPARGTGALDGGSKPVLSRVKLEVKWERSSPAGDTSLLFTYSGSPRSSQAPEWRLEGRWTLPVQWGQPPVRSGGPATAAGQEDLANLVFLSGRVFVDNNGNGRFDQGDEGVGEAAVTLDERTTVRTDADGRYQVQLLGAGRHQVTLDLASIPLELGLAPGAAARRAVDLQAGREGNAVDFALVRLCSLAGLLFLDANGNGIRDAGEPGLGGVYLQLAGTPFSTFTAADGTFAFYDVYPGEWRLVAAPASLPETVDKTKPVELVLSLAPGESRAGVLLPAPAYVQEIEWTF